MKRQRSVGGLNICDQSSEVISLIFNYLILRVENFHLFGKLLMAWHTKRTKPIVKDVLEKLDWDALYQYHNHQYEVVRDMFHDFVKFAVKYRVEQALFYESVWNLFLFHNVDHYLPVLESLSGTHFPSSFACIVFKSIYNPLSIDETVLEMSQLFNQKHMRGRLAEQIALLESIYSYITEFDKLLPANKFCPHARNKEPFSQIDGFPYGDELWNSLCEITAEGIHVSEDQYYPRRLTMKHMWETECAYCKMQLILFKILLSAMTY